MSVIPLPTARRPVALVVAVDAFLDRFRDDPATRATYTETLRRLRETAGDQLPVAALTPELYEQTMSRWDQRAANTWNKHLSALTSSTAYCRRQDWLTADPGRARAARRQRPWSKWGRPLGLRCPRHRLRSHSPIPTVGTGVRQNKVQCGVS